jgi:hypothetical protein
MSCDCDFDNSAFHDYIEELQKKKKGNHRLTEKEIIKFTTLGKGDDSKVGKIIKKKKIDLCEMRILNTRCCGVVNIEFTGSGEVKGNDIYFHINMKNVFFDLKSDIPNVDADFSRKIVWHMHPWNYSLDHKRGVPSFFSKEDLVISVNYPQKIFIIFNMFVKNPKLPVIYVVKSEKDIKKKKATKLINDEFKTIEKKFRDEDYRVDFKRLKSKFEEVGYHFDYMYRYDRSQLVKIVKQHL